MEGFAMTTDPNGHSDGAAEHAPTTPRRPHKPTGLTPLRTKKPKAEQPG
jgi:hypothetical protein